MESPRIPENEAERLAKLAEYDVLDSPPEERFDRIARLARRLFGTPLALITLIDRERQWFKSAEGMPITETPRAVSLCAHVVGDDRLMVVLDTARDAALQDHPVVTSGRGPRFYAGAPLRTPDGHVIGTLCLMDPQPRAEFDPAQRQALQDLADLVIDELELRRLLKALSYQALHDMLTGLPNRSLFENRLAHQLAHAKRFDETVAVLLIDLDDFKAVNDREGHEAGDRLLRRVAQRLAEHFRASDTIARWGGDEFCGLVSLEGADCLPPLLERLGREVLAPLAAEFGIGMSIGAAFFPRDAQDGRQLMALADAAMYRAKRAGKSRYALHGGEPQGLAGLDAGQTGGD